MSLIFWGNDQMTIKWVRFRIDWNLVMIQRICTKRQMFKWLVTFSTGLNRSGFYLLQTILVCNYLTYRSWNSVGDSPPPTPAPQPKGLLNPTTCFNMASQIPHKLPKPVMVHSSARGFNSPLCFYTANSAHTYKHSNQCLHSLDIKGTLHQPPRIMNKF